MIDDIVIDECQILFDKAVNSIYEFWNKDLHDALVEKYPELCSKLDGIDIEMENSWGVNYESFRKAMVEYYKIYKYVKDMEDKNI